MTPHWRSGSTTRLFFLSSPAAEGPPFEETEIESGVEPDAAAGTGCGEGEGFAEVVVDAGSGDPPALPLLLKWRVILDFFGGCWEVESVAIENAK